MKKIVLILAIVALNSEIVLAAGATAKAKQVVISALNISKVSDLEFGEAPQGDPEKTVAADSSDNKENASFVITGEPGKSVTITLPSDGTVKMITESGGADKEINVNSFKANLTTTTIGAAGSEDLFVGATREALSTTQKSGSYEGDFTVTVVY